jgi:radical SAM superfamily enzyme YgiQ (UPF0313 family)
MSQTRALLVQPRFTAPSFWNYSSTCEIVGAKYPAPPLGLITVAAMLPAGWELRLVDRNTTELTDADLAWADLVMVGGMIVQQPDLLAVIALAQAMGKLVVVGGPEVTSSPHLYAHADFRVLGEAESVIQDFIAAFEAGESSGTFEAEKFQADVTASPVPRYDLLRVKDYTNLSLQFSRGCPFTCEFCDIIELYGRKPRIKTNAQMLAELDAILALGYRGHVDFVDDNLVGNKKALKLFLPELIAWQKARGYPFEFTTEASINLADDAELLAMLRQANFFGVFIGIESPDPETLRQMQKKQNTRRSIPESIGRLHAAGISVSGGFIIGFDNEREAVAEGMIGVIEDSAIPIAMVGLLYALPNTQLTRRLEREGRLHLGHDVIDPDAETVGDQCTGGLNFDTLRPRLDVLEDFRRVIEQLYTPESYFGRVRALGLALRIRPAARSIAWRDSAQGLGFLLLLGWHFRRAGWAVNREFWRMVAQVLRRNPRALKQVILVSSLYTHLGPFSGRVLRGIEAEMEAVRAGEWQAGNALVLTETAPDR